MKRKAISSLLCVLAIMQMSITPAYATNTTQQTSTPGNQSATITYDQGSKFTVTIPKTIALDKTKTDTYNVKVEGDISADEAVTVTPDATVAMADTNNKKSVTGTITQEKTKFVATEVNQADGTSTTGTITANDLTAGNWSGQFNFYINVDANKHTHNYVESITKAATCTDTGVKTLTCDCGDTYTETIPATGHNYENGTCTECGAKDPEDTGVTGQDITLTKSDLTKYGISTKGNVEIPKYVTDSDGTKHKVVGIGDQTFNGCKGLTSITIPDSVTSIEHGAFSNCTGLTSITIPNSVTSIGQSAFNDSGLTSITIPNSVTSIGDNVFTRCNNLASITIPDSVTSIEYAAFYSCTGLTSITIPDSITSIGNSAFDSCKSLASVTYKGQTYTSRSALKTALTNNNVTLVGANTFSSTALTY